MLRCETAVVLAVLALTPLPVCSGSEWQQQQHSDAGFYPTDPRDPDKDSIAGVRNQDYPALAAVPDTSFRCSDQQYRGYYADPEAHCQVFHYCPGSAFASVSYHGRHRRSEKQPPLIKHEAPRWSFGLRGLPPKSGDGRVNVQGKVKQKLNKVKHGSLKMNEDFYKVKLDSHKVKQDLKKVNQDLIQTKKSNGQKRQSWHASFEDESSEIEHAKHRISDRLKEYLHINDFGKSYRDTLLLTEQYFNATMGKHRNRITKNSRKARDVLNLGNHQSSNSDFNQPGSSRNSHLGSPGLAGASFLCPTGTVFHQQYFVCVWWYDFDCGSAHSLYPLNNFAFGNPGDIQQFPNQGCVGTKGQFCSNGGGESFQTYSNQVIAGNYQNADPTHHEVNTISDHHSSQVHVSSHNTAHESPISLRNPRENYIDSSIHDLLDVRNVAQDVFSDLFSFEQTNFQSETDGVVTPKVTSRYSNAKPLTQQTTNVKAKSNKGVNTVSRLVSPGHSGDQKNGRALATHGGGNVPLGITHVSQHGYVAPAQKGGSRPASHSSYVVPADKGVSRATPRSASQSSFVISAPKDGSHSVSQSIFVAPSHKGGSHLVSHSVSIAPAQKGGSHPASQSSFVAPAPKGGSHPASHSSFVAPALKGGSHPASQSSFVAPALKGGSHPASHSSFVAPALKGGSHPASHSSFVAPAPKGGSHPASHSSFVAPAPKGGSHPASHSSFVAPALKGGSHPASHSSFVAPAPKGGSHPASHSSFVAPALKGGSHPASHSSFVAPAPKGGSHPASHSSFVAPAPKGGSHPASHSSYVASPHDRGLLVTPHLDSQNNFVAPVPKGDSRPTSHSRYVHPPPESGSRVTPRTALHSTFVAPASNVGSLSVSLNSVAPPAPIGGSHPASHSSYVAIPSLPQTGSWSDTQVKQQTRNPLSQISNFQSPPSHNSYASSSTGSKDSSSHSSSGNSLSSFSSLFSSGPTVNSKDFDGSSKTSSGNTHSRDKSLERFSNSRHPTVPPSIVRLPKLNTEGTFRALVGGGSVPRNSNPVSVGKDVANSNSNNKLFGNNIGKSADGIHQNSQHKQVISYQKFVFGDNDRNNYIVHSNNDNNDNINANKDFNNNFVENGNEDDVILLVDSQYDEDNSHDHTNDNNNNINNYSNNNREHNSNKNKNKGENLNYDNRKHLNDNNNREQLNYDNNREQENDDNKKHLNYQYTTALEYGTSNKNVGSRTIVQTSQLNPPYEGHNKNENTKDVSYFIHKDPVNVNENIFVKRDPGNVNENTFVKRDPGNVNENTFVNGDHGNVNEDTFVKRDPGNVNENTFVKRDPGNVNENTFVKRDPGNVNENIFVKRDPGNVNENNFVKRDPGNVNENTFVKRDPGNVNENTFVKRDPGNVNENTFVKRDPGNVNENTLVKAWSVAVREPPSYLSLPEPRSAYREHVLSNHRNYVSSDMGNDVFRSVGGDVFGDVRNHGPLVDASDVRTGNVDINVVGHESSLRNVVQMPVNFVRTPGNVIRSPVTDVQSPVNVAPDQINIKKPVPRKRNYNNRYVSTNVPRYLSDVSNITENVSYPDGSDATAGAEQQRAKAGEEEILFTQRKRHVAATSTITDKKNKKVKNIVVRKKRIGPLHGVRAVDWSKRNGKAKAAAQHAARSSGVVTASIKQQDQFRNVNIIKQSIDKTDDIENLQGISLDILASNLSDALPNASKSNNGIVNTRRKPNNALNFKLIRESRGRDVLQRTRNKTLKYEQRNTEPLRSTWQYQIETQNTSRNIGNQPPHSNRVPAKNTILRRVGLHYTPGSPYFIPHTESISHIIQSQILQQSPSEDRFNPLRQSTDASFSPWREYSGHVAAPQAETWVGNKHNEVVLPRRTQTPGHFLKSSEHINGNTFFVTAPSMSFFVGNEGAPGSVGVW